MINATQNNGCGGGEILSIKDQKDGSKISYVQGVDGYDCFEIEVYIGVNISISNSNFINTHNTLS